MTAKDLYFRTRPQREIASFRSVAAVIVATGSAWILADSELRKGMGMVIGVTGLVAAIGWVLAALRVRRTIDSATQGARLRLLPETLELYRAEGLSESIAWSDIQKIEADEEKLVVRLTTRGGCVDIPPFYGTLGLYELERELRNAWQQRNADIRGA